MSYFVGFLSLIGLLRSHHDPTYPIYLAPWGVSGLSTCDPDRDPCLLVSDVQDGVGRYCLVTETEATSFTGTSSESTAIKQRIEREFGFAVEDAVISLPTQNFLHVAGTHAVILPVELWHPKTASTAPEINERGRARYEAIRPILDDLSRTTEAVQARAGEVGVGVSTLYAWLKRYDPKLGPASLSGSRRRDVPRTSTSGSSKSDNDDADKQSNAQHGPTYWLHVESRDDWIADKVAQFNVIGVEDRMCPLAELAVPGDIVITYVKGRGFADIRRVCDGGLIPLNGQVQYTDGIFPYVLRTEPVTVLPFDKHVPVGSLGNERHAKRLQFRNSLQRLAPEDGKYFEMVLREHAAA